jgi:hypothetical protein
MAQAVIGHCVGVAEHVGGGCRHGRGMHVSRPIPRLVAETARGDCRVVVVVQFAGVPPQSAGRSTASQKELSSDP